MFNADVSISILSDSDSPPTERIKIPQQRRHPSELSGKRHSLIEYDESEGVSDVSFASDSCASMRSKAARGSFRITSPIPMVRKHQSDVYYAFFSPGRCLFGSCIEILVVCQAQERTWWFAPGAPYARL